MWRICPKRSGAFSGSESIAVQLVPVLAVFALFFSEPLMKGPGESLNGDKSLGARFARNLPAHYAHLAMSDAESDSNPKINALHKETLDNLHADTRALAKTARNRLALCFLIALVAQTMHEKHWKG